MNRMSWLSFQVTPIAPEPTTVWRFQTGNGYGGREVLAAGVLWIIWLSYLQKGIHETTEYLEAFLRHLLLNEKNELHNRNLHISGLLNEEKVDIQDGKVDIESVLSQKGSDFSVKTTIHIHRLFEKFGFDEVFGRSAVMELLELKGSGASKLPSNLVQADIIEPVSGHGKGKYKFKK